MTPKSFATAQWRAHLTKLAALLFASAIAGTVACGGGSDSATGPTKSPVGVWTLRKADGKSLPAQVYAGPYYSERDDRNYEVFDVRMTGGTFTLDADGTYHSALNYVVGKDGRDETGALRVDGKWVVDGEDIILISDMGAGGGTIVDGTMTLWFHVVQQGTDKPYLYTK